MSVATMNSYEKDIELVMMAKKIMKARKSRQKALDDFKARAIAQLSYYLLKNIEIE